MTWPIDIVRDISETKFAEMFAVNPRSVREALFSRLGIKAQTRRIGIRTSAKNTERIHILYERLVGRDSKMERELASELIRNWLYTQRPLLADTLGHFEIKHDNGLTDTEIDFFEKLDADQVRQLCELLVPRYGVEDVALYLRYVKVPGVLDVLAAMQRDPGADTPVSSDHPDAAG